eukprot:NODE_5319_length_516_cov_189.770878_g3943_i0.p2 GENE.NODE_5319_length_516_cov_189.770878_g3943_i0~~NODE_5319_length_516_cov_189.770878_g3943_i0.p2  ORF type:complete len:68 (-),score=6.23 NODE_5319_length_516_cov_189.770878_g3943_i0:69-272(-)
MLLQKKTHQLRLRRPGAGRGREVRARVHQVADAVANQAPTEVPVVKLRPGRNFTLTAAWLCSFRCHA